MHRGTAQRVLAAARQLSRQLTSLSKRQRDPPPGDDVIQDGLLLPGDSDDDEGVEEESERVPSGGYQLLERGMDPAILISLAFPDRIAQRRDRSNR